MHFGYRAPFEAEISLGSILRSLIGTLNAVGAVNASPQILHGATHGPHAARTVTVVDSPQGRPMAFLG